MAWTDGVDKSTGDIITAAAWNNYFGASGDINLTAPYLASAAGDLFQATGSKVLARLAKGTRNQYLQTNSATNAVEWAASPASLLDAKGEVLSASAANTPVAVTKGTNDHVLEARASEAAGVRFVALSAGDAGANPEGLFPVIADQTYTGVFSSALVANRGYYWPLQSVQQSATISTYITKLANTAGNYILGLFSVNAAGSTLTKVAESSSTAFPSNSDSAELTGLSTTVNAGTSYFGAIIANNTPSLPSLYSDQGQGHRCYYLDAGSFALPSSVTMSATTQSHGPTGGCFVLSTGKISAA